MWSWRHEAQGRLAEIIMLNQFFRPLLRDQSQAFSQYGMTLALAQEAISLKLDFQLKPLE